MLFIVAMVLFPGLIADETKTSSLLGRVRPVELAAAARARSTGSAPTSSGCDVYSLTHLRRPAQRHGGRHCTLVTTLFGGTVGLIAGFYGGWLDSVLSRIVDVFFALPLIVVGIAVLSVISLPGIWGVVLVLCILGWVSAARMVRGADHRGQGPGLHDRRTGPGRQQQPDHEPPHPAQRDGPGIVLAVLGLGVFISAEATFSFLGLGIRPPAFSWGTIIAESQAVFFRRRGRCCSRPSS